jgi:hypothetical protein
LAPPAQRPAHVPLPLQGAVVRAVVVMVQEPGVAEHVWHCPEQADSQQYPSTQWTVEHSGSPAHRSPLLRATQVPLLHTGVLPLQPPQHSALAMHAPLHGFRSGGQLVKHNGASVRQPNGQDVDSEGVHPPFPLQRAAVFWRPPVQDAATPHDLVSPG